MKALSIYSGGCDGLSLAASWCGIETVAYCEADEACRAVLAARHPDKPIFHIDEEVATDAMRARGIEPRDVDIILASPPCQCASVAGMRLGSADGRNRWPECLRIVRDVAPRWFMAENVCGLLSVDDGRLFGGILRELAALGYDARWCVYGAVDVGAHHERERLCLVANTDGFVGKERDRVYEKYHRTVQRALKENSFRGLGEISGAGKSGALNGVSGRVDRLTMLGNAVVPQWACVVLAAIKEIDDVCWRA